MSLFVLGNDFVTMSLTTELAPPIPRILLTLFALDPNFNSEFRILIVSVVNLTLLYTEKEGCHSREGGNPVEKTGFRIKSGMTFSVK